MIEVSGLSKSYQNIRAVEDVSFSVERGEIVGFLGPNGAGKTTTMRILTGAIPADRGTAVVAGFDIFEQPMEVKRRIGYLPENPPLYMDLTVLDYLDFTASLKGLKGVSKSREVHLAMGKCNISDVQGRLIGNLSKGYKQRVGIAQAILGSPEVLILDEPTIGLDPNQIHEVRTLIKALAKERTVILSTHILPEVEMTCQKVVVIHKGRIVATDTIDGIVKGRSGGRQVYVRVKNDSSGAAQKVRSSLLLETEPGHEPDSFMVIMNPDEDRRDELAKLIVDGGHGLIELKARELSLEDVFRQLTTDETRAA